MRTPTKIAISYGFILMSAALIAPKPVFCDENAAESVQRITALRSAFNEAIANHDAASIARYLDSRYQITTSNGEHYQETPDEDAASWASIFRDRPDVVYVRTPDLIELSSYYDLAAENGTWVGRWRSSEGDVEMGGKYFAQWRKADGDWKIRAEIFVGLYCNGQGCRATE